MKETILNSELSETLTKWYVWREVTATITKTLGNVEDDFMVNISLSYTMKWSYDDVKQDVLWYFNKLKLDTSKLLIDSNGNPVVIDPKINIPVADVPKQEGPYVVLSWSTEKPKRKVGRPKGSKTKKQDIKKDLEKKAAKKKSELDPYNFFSNLPEDNIFSQAWHR